MRRYRIWALRRKQEVKIIANEKIRRLAQQREAANNVDGGTGAVGVGAARRSNNASPPLELRCQHRHGEARDAVRRVGVRRQRREDL